MYPFFLVKEEEKEGKAEERKGKDRDERKGNGKKRIVKQKRFSEERRAKQDKSGE